jgi:hypothetical protein
VKVWKLEKRQMNARMKPTPPRPTLFVVNIASSALGSYLLFDTFKGKNKNE